LRKLSCTRNIEVNMS